MNIQIQKRLLAGSLLASLLTSQSTATSEYIDTSLPFQTTTASGSAGGNLVPRPLYFRGYTTNNGNQPFQEAVQTDLLFGEAFRWFQFGPNVQGSTAENGIELECRFLSPTKGMRSFKTRVRGSLGCPKYWRVAVEKEVSTNNFVRYYTSPRITIDAANQWQNIAVNWPTASDQKFYDRVRIFPDRENGLFVGLAATSGQTTTYSEVSTLDLDNVRSEVKRTLAGVLTTTGTNQSLFTYGFRGVTGFGPILSQADWVRDLGPSSTLETIRTEKVGSSDNGSSGRPVVPNLLTTTTSGATIQLGNHEFTTIGLGATSSGNGSGVATWFGQVGFQNGDTYKYFGLNSQGMDRGSLMIEKLSSSGSLTHIWIPGAGQAAIIPNLQGRSIQAIGDFNGDACPDILTKDLVSSDLYMLYAVWNEYNGTPQLVFQGFGNNTHILKVADLNDDGIDDLLIRDAANSIFAMKMAESSAIPGTLRFTYDWIWDIPTNVTQFGIADANADDILDLYYLIPSSSNTTVRDVYIRNCSVQNGDVQVSNFEQWICQIAPDLKLKSIGDINNDRCADLITVQDVAVNPFLIQIAIFNSNLQTQVNCGTINVQPKSFIFEM